MTYLQTRKSASYRHAKTFVVIFILLVFIYAAFSYFRPSFFPSIFTALTRPFWRFQTAVNLGALETPDQLLAENQQLKLQLDEAAIRLETVALIESENLELKALLGRASTTNYIAAAVLKRPPLSGYDEIIVDAGQDLGFKVGNNVYAPGNILIGRIVEVLGQTSRVRLFSSPGETYSVLVGKSHSPATAVGRGGGQYEAELPRDIKVSVGDFVIAPNMNSRTFGIVSALLTDPAQPFEKVLFSQPINLYELRFVLVDPTIRLI